MFRSIQYSGCISGLVKLQPGPVPLLPAGETDRVIGNLRWTEKDNHGLRYCDVILLGGCWTKMKKCDIRPKKQIIFYI